MRHVSTLFGNSAHLCQTAPISWQPELRSSTHPSSRSAQLLLPILGKKCGKKKCKKTSCISHLLFAPSVSSRDSLEFFLCSQVNSYQVAPSEHVCETNSLWRCQFKQPQQAHTCQATNCISYWIRLFNNSLQHAPHLVKNENWILY